MKLYLPTILPENFIIINLNNYNNTELKQAVLDKTTKKYKQVLEYFNI